MRAVNQALPPKEQLPGFMGRNWGWRGTDRAAQDGGIASISGSHSRRQNFQLG